MFGHLVLRGSLSLPKGGLRKAGTGKPNRHQTIYMESTKTINIDAVSDTAETTVGKDSGRSSATEEMDRKRKRLDLSTESQDEQTLIWPTYLVLSTLGTKISPFAVEKTISTAAGNPEHVAKLRSGDYLIKSSSKKQAQKLLSINSIMQHPVICKPHPSMNQSKCIITTSALDGCSYEEILDGLGSQLVSNVKRLGSSNTYLLTFDSPNMPPHVNIGWACPAQSL